MCNRQSYFMRKMHRHGHADAFRNFRWKLDQWEKDPPVNVEEFDDKYVLYLSAPGFERDDFKVNIKDETLVIHAKRNKKEEAEGQWRRREFGAEDLERYFQLNEKIDKEAISAKYEDGVLKIFLPKLAGFESFRHQIDVD